MALERSSRVLETDRLDLLLLGNSRNETQSFLEHAADEIDQLFSDAQSVLLIPYACPPSSGAVEKARAYMASRGKASIVADDSVDAHRQLSRSDGVFILGGNTWRLLRHLYDNRLLEPLRTFANTGKPMLGTSAGSNVMCPTIATTNDMAITEVPSLKALDLVPFQINAHYVSTELYIDDFTGESREQRIEEYAEETGESVLALPEGCGVRLTAATFIITGGKSAIIFDSSGRQTQVPPGPLSSGARSVLGID